MQWGHVSQLFLNPMKTQHMTFNLRGAALPKIPKLLVQNIEIERVNSFKCFKVILDDKLNRTKHINNLCHKLISSKFLLNNVKTILTSEIKCMLCMFMESMYRDQDCKKVIDLEYLY